MSIQSPGHKASRLSLFAIMLLTLSRVIAVPAASIPSDTSTVSDTVRTDHIVEMQRELPLWERLIDVHALSDQIGSPDLKRLYAFLKSPEAPAGLKPHHVWALKNDILNTLREQVAPSNEYQRVLLAIYQNPKHDTVMHDYAIQHARPWFPFSTNKSELLEMLWSASQRFDKSFSSTALLSLWGIWMASPNEIDVHRLAVQAEFIAGNPQANIDARISAIQLCGQLKAHEALPLAQRIAQEGRPEQFRMAAIATLGDLGDASMATWLQQLGTGAEHETGIQTAINAALNKIKNRQSQ